MNDHLTYMRWLHELEARQPHITVTSRSYKNTSGTDELIWLSEPYWDYVDWLEARSEISFADWVIHCEQNPHEGASLSSLLMYWLWQDECSRWMNNLPTGSDRLPKGFRFWKASYGGRVWTAGYGG